MYFPDRQDTKETTIGELIEYLKQFPSDAPIYTDGGLGGFEKDYFEYNETFGFVEFG